MVLVHDTLSHCALEVYKVSNQIALTVLNLQCRQKNAFSYVTRGIIWFKHERVDRVTSATYSTWVSGSVVVTGLYPGR